MNNLRKALAGPSILVVALLSTSVSSFAQAPSNSTANQAPPSSFDQVVDRMVEQERLFNEQMRTLRPLVETYIQTLAPDAELGLAPAGDTYFLGRVDLKKGIEDRSFLERPKGAKNVLAKLSRPFVVPRFLSRRFAQMVLVDSDFDRNKYEFAFVRREFLSEIRCIVMDVRPKKDTGEGRFIGRVWVEDQGYNIVRFNGTYGSVRKPTNYFHFDSWRLNMHPGMWLPAYVYSEESNINVGPDRKLKFKAQTRLWGYDLQRASRNDEFTQIVVEAQQSVRDRSENAQDATPVESQRLWQRQAEDNAIEHMQKVGLMAQEGEVDKVLQTVANNLIVTNGLNPQPEVRTRVMLTLPLESFTIGHTIVISRGLLDVLPDEASLAMVIAHELSHITLGHSLDTTLAFNDKMYFNDENTLEEFDFARDPAEEASADQTGMQLLANSPYKGKLESAALFLRVLQTRAPELKHLIRSHLGNNLADVRSATVRMGGLLASAPQLEMGRIDQLAALPLGARVKLDPWTSRIELVKAKPVSLTLAREKMPFEVTPFFPYLTRVSNPGAEKMALAPPE